METNYDFSDKFGEFGVEIKSMIENIKSSW